MIVGVDEAGRGPLAGPVVAAAVVLGRPAVRGLADSKALSPAARAGLDERIRARCRVGVGLASVEEIDRLNIFAATMLAMTRAVAQLCEGGAEPTEVRVDGPHTPAGRVPGWRWPAIPLVGGDAREHAIMAASIVAKEHRDRLIRIACAAHPGYGFARHKGYATAEHRAALTRLGPCAIHRRSFAPVRLAENRTAESSGQHTTGGVPPVD